MPFKFESERQFNYPHDAGGSVGSAEPKLNDELTVDYGVRLLYNALEFAQNADDLLRWMFEYIHLQHPHWKLTPQLKIGIFRQIRPAIEQRVQARGTTRNDSQPQRHLHAPVYKDHIGMQISIEGFLDEVQTGLHALKPLNDQLISRISDGLIKRDHRFIVELDGRKYGDKYHSYFIHHGINGAPTKAQEFDQMFQDINRYATTNLNNGIWTPQSHPMLFQIADVYYSNHRNFSTTTTIPS